MYQVTYYNKRDKTHQYFWGFSQPDARDFAAQIAVETGLPWITENPDDYEASEQVNGKDEVFATIRVNPKEEATGGTIKPGTIYIVGELGPEWFTPDSGTIISDNPQDSFN